jgi:hypothetical protein
MPDVTRENLRSWLMESIEGKAPRNFEVSDRSVDRIHLANIEAWMWLGNAFGLWDFEAEGRVREWAQSDDSRTLAEVLDATPEIGDEPIDD